MAGRGRLQLSIYGVNCVIVDRTRDHFGQEYLNHLEKVFAHFVTSGKMRPNVAVAIVDSPESNLTQSWRKVSWKNGPVVRFAVGKESRVATFSLHQNLAGYIENYLNSAVGEILEKKGWF